MTTSDRYRERLDAASGLRVRAIGDGGPSPRPPTAGLADSVLSILRTRQLYVTAAVQHRIETCADVGLLDHWFSRVSVVDLAEDIFED